MKIVTEVKKYFLMKSFGSYVSNYNGRLQGEVTYVPRELAMAVTVLAGVSSRQDTPTVFALPRSFPLPLPQMLALALNWWET